MIFQTSQQQGRYPSVPPRLERLSQSSRSGRGSAPRHNTHWKFKDCVCNGFLLPNQWFFSRLKPRFVEVLRGSFVLLRWMRSLFQEGYSRERLSQSYSGPHLPLLSLTSSSKSPLSFFKFETAPETGN